MRLVGAFALICVLLAACSKEAMQVSDQCMRVELFRQCMAALPAGPVSTHYSDWDEVVDSCESAAFYQSLRQRGFVKPECQP